MKSFMSKDVMLLPIIRKDLHNQFLLQRIKNRKAVPIQPSLPLIGNK